jgi:hypothetical protein
MTIAPVPVANLLRGDALLHAGAVSQGESEQVVNIQRD